MKLHLNNTNVLTIASSSMSGMVSPSIINHKEVWLMEIIAFLIVVYLFNINNMLMIIVRSV